MRPFRIGKHKVTQAEFDAEVMRLYKMNLGINQIAERLRRERTAIWRSISRTEKAAGGAVVIEKAKEARTFYEQTHDEFLNESLVKEWVEDMKTRRVAGWKRTAYRIKAICNDLQIFPDQLDLEWGKKWLALKAAVPLEQLRQTKTAARSFFQSQGATDYELTQAGFDAKHYAVGKWKHVKMTDEEIGKMKVYLRHEIPEAQFVFAFGIETCRTLEPIWNLESNQFYTMEVMPTVGHPERKTLYAVNIFRHKTEKSGAAYKTAYVSQSTYDLALHLGAKNGGRVMNGYTPDAIRSILKGGYKTIGLTVDYFFMHPIHALRHSGAQRYLEKTGFNRAVVAEIGGWEAEKTLEDHYGGVPVDIVRAFAVDLL